jgi:hypothetical protein
MARTVDDPRGGGWRVRRVWVERRTRFPGTALVQRNNPNAGVLLIPLAAGYAVTVFFEFLGELVGHVLLGRPWTIEARKDALKRDVLHWRVAGWRASRRALAETAAALARGEEVTRFGEPERSVADAEGRPLRLPTS